MKPFRVITALALVVGGVACRKSPPPAPPPHVRAAPHAPPVLDADAPTAKVRISPEAARAEAERDIRAVIERWVAAQNRGDFAAYTALYDQAHFRGQKRTKTGRTTRADWASWRDDRAKMFEKGAMTVAVEDLAIRTWLDRSATLRPGVSEARFVQRWRNPRYADHGRVVRLLLHAHDQDWAEREFRKLLPKRGKIVFREESTDEMAGPDGHQSSEQKIPVRDVSLGMLPEALGARSDSAETYDAGHVDKAGLEFDANGLLVRVWKTSWSGCPC